MKRLHPTLPCASLLFLFLPLCLVFAEDEEAEEVFELSPFVVSGEKDTGYRSTSTLAKTRLNTDLRDIGSSITIVNQAFIQDTGSQDIEDILVLTPNTEIGGLGGNYSATQTEIEGGAPVLGRAIPEVQRDNPSGGITRIRGLTEADLMRNFFMTDVPFDTFNVERVVIQRGANAALYGMGSPGGIVNHTTVRAGFRGTEGQVRFATDQYGTRRGAFRCNVEALERRLAILVAGLDEETAYEQEEAFSNDRRIYLSAMARLTKDIRLHASGEWGEVHASRPDYIPPNDGITPWIQLGKPIVENPAEGADLFRGGGTFLPGVANRLLWAPATQGTSSGFVSFYHDPDIPGPTFGGNVFVRRNRGAPGGGPYGELMLVQPRPTNFIIGSTGFFPDGTPVDEGVARFYNSGSVDRQILDRSIFDYRKHLFSGGSSQQFSDWQLFETSLEGNWFDYRLGAELAVYDESFDTGANNSLHFLFPRTLFIDPNRHLVATVDGQPGSAWIPNPTFGRPVMGGISNSNDIETTREYQRATAYFEVHAEDFMEAGWFQKLLGRLRVTGLAQTSKTGKKEAYGQDKLDLQTVAGAIGGGQTGAIHPATFRTGMFFALPVNGNVDFLGAASLRDLEGADIGAVPYGRSRNRPPENYTYTGWDQVSGSFVEFNSRSYSVQDNHGYPSAFYAGKIKEELESRVLVGQHYLWNDTLVLIGTWRKDKVHAASVTAPPTGIWRIADTFDPEYVAGPEDLSLAADGETTSWSMVLHTPPFLKPHLPAGTEISLHYSKAENFVPTRERLNVFNEPLDSITGTTEEAGFTVSLIGGKFLARVNWFETAVLNKSLDEGGVTATEGILLNLVRQLNNPENLAQGFTADDAQAVLPPEGVLELNGFVPDWANATATTNRNVLDDGTQDFTADGMEIEIFYNPSPEWTLLCTVARQETITTNTYPALQRYVEEFVRPVWVESAFARNYFINDLATETLAQRADRTIVIPVARTRLRDGMPGIEQREWRVSLYTRYRFGPGHDGIPAFLGDLTIGGGLRWEDKMGIGFGVAMTDFGEYALNREDPFFAPSQTFIDLFLRSRYEIARGRELTLQLNIKDLTDHDGLYPFFANPDGSHLYHFREGRLITASATLSF